MEVTIHYNGQAVAVEVTLEVYEFLDRADHKTENLSHEQRRHWDGREFDEYIVATEGVGITAKRRRITCAAWKRWASCWPSWTPAARLSAAGSCSMLWTG